jgi:hypothetical protein
MPIAEAIEVMMTRTKSFLVSWLMVDLTYRDVDQA